MKRLYKKLSLLPLALAFVAFTSIDSNAQSKAKITVLTDPQIASVAVTANQVDISYADIALKKSTNEKVINFANTMKRDHHAVYEQCVALAKKLGVTPETNDVTKSLLDGEKIITKKLQLAPSGKTFDKLYVDNEVSYHIAVIKVVEETLIPQSKNEELKALLETVVPALKTHLEHAKMLQKEL